MPTQNQKTNPKRKLGRGLSSLIGEIENPNPSSDGTTSITIMDLSSIHPNPAQPRRHFDEDALIELSDSIKTHGIVQPIVVRPSRSDKNKHEIIAGERRWRAAKIANLSQTPVIIKDVDEINLLELGIIENIQRQDLNPLEEAHAYKALIDRFGRSQASIAESIGKSRAHITNLLRLLNSSEKVQDHLIKGNLSAGHARALLTMENSDDLVDRIIDENWSVRKLENYVADDTPSAKTTNKAKSAETKDLDTMALQHDLSTKLGLDVDLSHSNKGGVLKIKYRTLDQLDSVCRKLNS